MFQRQREYARDAAVGTQEEAERLRLEIFEGPLSRQFEEEGRTPRCGKCVLRPPKGLRSLTR